MKVSFRSVKKEEFHTHDWHEMWFYNISFRDLKGILRKKIFILQTYLILTLSHSSMTCLNLVRLHLRGITANTLRVFHVETTWKGPFPRCFHVECTWCICRDVFINLPLFGITSFQIGKKIQKLFTEKLFSHSLKTVFTSHIRVKSFFTFKEKLPKMSR